MSPGAIDGIVSGGSPTGNGPTTGRPDRVDRSNTADTTVAPTTAIRMPGTVGRQRLTPRMMARDTTADGEGDRDRLAVHQSRRERRGLAHQAVRIDTEAEQLGQLADDHDQGDAVEVADPDRRGQQGGQEAEPRDARRDDDHPGDDREEGRQGDRPCLVSGGQRHDRGSDERDERRVRTEDQDPRRPEGRVRQQRHDRGVQTDDRRQARRLRVAHPGRHEDRGQDEPGDDVLAQVAAAVRTHPREVGQDRCRPHVAGSVRPRTAAPRTRLQRSWKDAPPRSGRISRSPHGGIEHGTQGEDPRQRIVVVARVAGAEARTSRRRGPALRDDPIAAHRPRRRRRAPRAAGCSTRSSPTR